MDNSLKQISSSMSICYLNSTEVEGKKIHTYGILYNNGTQEKRYSIFSESNFFDGSISDSELEKLILEEISKEEKEIFYVGYISRKNGNTEFEKDPEVGKYFTGITSDTEEKEPENVYQKQEEPEEITSFILNDYTAFDEALVGMRSILKDDIYTELMDAVKTVKTAASDVPAKYSSPDEAISAAEEINAANQEKITKLAEGYEKLFQGILMAYGAEHSLMLDENRLRMDEDCIGKFDEADFLNEHREVDNKYKNTKLLLEDPNAEVNGPVYTTLGEYFGELHYIQSRYSVTNVQEATDLLMGRDKNDPEYAHRIYEAMAESTGMSEDEFYDLWDNHVEELAQKIADASFYGTEVDNSFLYDLQDEYYSSEPGQRKILQRFIDGSNCEYDDAIGYTNYIQWCMATGHTHDWLLAELRGIPQIIVRVQSDACFSTHEEVTSIDLLAQLETLAAKGEPLPYNVYMKDGKYYIIKYNNYGERMLHFMDNHYGELHFPADEGCADKNNRGDNRIRTAFSQQGYIEAVERNYRGGWIDSHSRGIWVEAQVNDAWMETHKGDSNARRDYDILTGKVEDQARYQYLVQHGEVERYNELVAESQNDYAILVGDVQDRIRLDELRRQGMSPAEIDRLHNTAVRDYAILNGEEESEERLQYLKDHGELSFEQMVSMLDALDGDYTKLYDSQFMHEHRDEILEKTGLEEKQLYNFTTANVTIADNWGLDRESTDQINGALTCVMNTGSTIACSAIQVVAGIIKFGENIVDCVTTLLHSDTLGGTRRDADTYNSYFYSELDEIINEYYPELKDTGIALREYLELSDDSSMSLYMGAYELAILTGGDFSFFDKKLPQNLKDKAKDQIEAAKKVAYDWTGALFENLYETGWYQAMEDHSLVKKDNVAGVVFNQVGNMAIPILVSMIPYVGEYLSSALLWMSAYGAAAEEGFQNAATGYDQVLQYAFYSATTELATEWMFGGIMGIGTGWLDNVLDFLPTKLLGRLGLADNVAAQIGKKLLVNGIGEVVEEVTTDLITPLWKSLTIERDLTYEQIFDRDVSWSSLAETALVSFLSSMIFGGVNIIKQVNTFNKSYGNIVSLIGNVPGMQEYANKALASMIANEAIGANPSVEVFNSIIEQYSIEMAKNPALMESLKTVQEQLIAERTKMNKENSTINYKGQTLSVSTESILAIADANNLRIGTDIVISENGEVNFKNPMQQEQFIKKMYKMAEQQNKSLAKLYNRKMLKLRLENALGIHQNIEDVISELNNIGENSYARNLTKTVTFEYNGKEYSIPLSTVEEVVKGNILKSKYTLDEHSTTLIFEEGYTGEFIKQLYTVTANRMASLEASYKGAAENLKMDLENGEFKRVKEVVGLLANTDMPFIISDVEEVKVGEKELVKLEVVTYINGEERTVNVFVDGKTSLYIYGNTVELREKINEVVSETGADNIYLGKIRTGLEFESNLSIEEVLTYELDPEMQEYVDNINATEGFKATEEYKKAIERHQQELEELDINHATQINELNRTIEEERKAFKEEHEKKLKEAQGDIAKIFAIEQEMTEFERGLQTRVEELYTKQMIEKEKLLRKNSIELRLLELAYEQTQTQGQAQEVVQTEQTQTQGQTEEVVQTEQEKTNVPDSERSLESLRAERDAIINRDTLTAEEYRREQELNSIIAARAMQEKGVQTEQTQTQGQTQEVVQTEQTQTQGQTEGVVQTEQTQTQGQTEGVVQTEQTQTQGQTEGVVQTEQTQTQGQTEGVVQTEQTQTQGQTEGVVQTEQEKTNVPDSERSLESLRAERDAIINKDTLTAEEYKREQELNSIIAARAMQEKGVKVSRSSDSSTTTTASQEVMDSVSMGATAGAAASIMTDVVNTSQTASNSDVTSSGQTIVEDINVNELLKSFNWDLNELNSIKLEFAEAIKNGDIASIEAARTKLNDLLAKMSEYISQIDKVVKFDSTSAITTAVREFNNALREFNNFEVVSENINDINTSYGKLMSSFDVVKVELNNEISKFNGEEESTPSTVESSEETADTSNRIILPENLLTEFGNSSTQSILEALQSGNISESMFGDVAEFAKYVVENEIQLNLSENVTNVINILGNIKEGNICLNINEVLNGNVAPIIMPATFHGISTVSILEALQNGTVNENMRAGVMNFVRYVSKNGIQLNVSENIANTLELLVTISKNGNICFNLEEVINKNAQPVVIPAFIGNIPTMSILKALQNGNISENNISSLIKVAEYIVNNDIQLNLSENVTNIIDILGKMGEDYTILNINEVINGNVEPIVLPEKIGLFNTKNIITNLKNGNISFVGGIQEFAQYVVEHNIELDLDENIITALNKLGRISEGQYCANIKSVISENAEPILIPAKFNYSSTGTMLFNIERGNVSFSNSLVELARYITENNIQVDLDENTINALGKIAKISGDNFCVNINDVISGISEPVLIPSKFDGMDTSSMLYYAEKNIPIPSYMNNSLTEFSKYIVQNNIKLNLNESTMEALNRLGSISEGSICVNVNDVINNGVMPITVPNQIVVGTKTIQTSKIIDVLSESNGVYSAMVSEYADINKNNIHEVLNAFFGNNESLKALYSDSLKLIEQCENSFVYRDNSFKYTLLSKEFMGVKTSDIVDLITGKDKTIVNRYINADVKTRLEMAERIKAFEKYVKEVNPKADLAIKNQIIEKLTRTVVEVTDVEVRTPLQGMFETMKNLQNQYGVNQGIVRNLIQRLGVNDVVNSLFGETINTKYFMQTLTEVNIDEQQLLDMIVKPDPDGIIRNVDGQVFASLIEQVQKNYPGMSIKDSIKVLYLLETHDGSRGICNYATVANMIFNNYIGNETQFEIDFGYPMYIQTANGRVLNDARLLTDMFTYINNDVLVKGENGNYTIANSNARYVNLAGYWEATNSFLESKRVSYRIDQSLAKATSQNIISYEEIITTIRENLKAGKNVMIGGAGFDIYSNGNLLRSDVGGHIMTVVGIDSNGNLIIDSWGRECTIDLRAELARAGEKFASKSEGKSNERYVDIQVYDIVDNSAITNTSSTTVTANMDAELESARETIADDEFIDESTMSSKFDNEDSVSTVQNDQTTIPDSERSLESLRAERDAIIGKKTLTAAEYNRERELNSLIAKRAMKEKGVKVSNTKSTVTTTQEVSTTTIQSNITLPSGEVIDIARITEVFRNSESVVNALQSGVIEGINVKDVFKAIKEAQISGTQIELDSAAQSIVDTYASLSEGEVLLNPVEAYNGQTSIVMSETINGVSTQEVYDALVSGKFDTLIEKIGTDVQTKQNYLSTLQTMMNSEVGNVHGIELGNVIKVVEEIKSYGIVDGVLIAGDLTIDMSIIENLFSDSTRFGQLLRSSAITGDISTGFSMSQALEIIADAQNNGLSISVDQKVQDLIDVYKTLNSGEMLFNPFDVYNGGNSIVLSSDIVEKYGSDFISRVYGNTLSNFITPVNNELLEQFANEEAIRGKYVYEDGFTGALLKIENGLPVSFNGVKTSELINFLNNGNLQGRNISAYINALLELSNYVETGTMNTDILSSSTLSRVASGISSISDILKCNYIGNVRVSNIFKNIKVLQNSGIQIQLEENIQTVVDTFASLKEGEILFNVSEVYNGKTAIVLTSDIVSKYGLRYIEDIRFELEQGLNPLHSENKIEYFIEEPGIRENYILSDAGEIIRIENGVPIKFRGIETSSLLEYLSTGVTSGNISNYVDAIHEFIDYVKAYNIGFVRDGNLYFNSNFELVSNEGISHFIDIDFNTFTKLSTLSHLDRNSTILNMEEFLNGKENAVILPNYIGNNKISSTILLEALQTGRITENMSAELVEFSKYVVSHNIPLSSLKLDQNALETISTLSRLSKDALSKLSKDGICLNIRNVNIVDVLNGLQNGRVNLSTDMVEFANNVFRNNLQMDLGLNQTAIGLLNELSNLDYDVVSFIIDGNTSTINRYLNSDRRTRMDMAARIKAFSKNNFVRQVTSSNIHVDSNILNQLTRRDVRVGKVAIRTPLQNMFEKMHLIQGQYGVNQGAVNQLIHRIGVNDAIGIVFGNTIERENIMQALSDMNIDGEKILDVLAKMKSNSMFKNVDLPTLKKLISRVIDNYPGMNVREAIKVLYLLESSEAGRFGICNYATVANMIFNKYIGNEAQFEIDFGYPMYVQTANGPILNDAMLLTDMYSYSNNGVLIKNVNGRYIIENSNARDVNLASDWTAINKFLAHKGVSYRVNEEIRIDTHRNSSILYENVIKGIYESLKAGKNVMIGGAGFTLYGDGRVSNDVGGHIMTVVGIDNNGHLIVDSWGRQYKIDLKAELARVGERFKSKNEAQASTRRLDIRVYDFVGNGRVNVAPQTASVRTFEATETSRQSIEVKDVSKLKMTTGLNFSKTFNYNDSYRGYDFVVSPKTTLSEAIASITSNNIEGRVLLEIQDTLELNADLIASIPDNVEVRIVGSYSESYLNRITNPNEAVAFLNKATYTKEQLLQINEELTKFDSLVDPNWSDMEKARFIYDYLSNDANMTYVPLPPGGNFGRGAQFDGLMSLVAKESTCNGFAHTYQALAQRLGLECYELSGVLSVTPTNKVGNGHAFNAVVIDGKTILVDTVRKYQNAPFNNGTGFGVTNVSEYNIQRNQVISANDINAHNDGSGNIVSSDVTVNMDSEIAPARETIADDEFIDESRVTSTLDEDVSESPIESIQFMDGESMTIEEVQEFFKSDVLDAIEEGVDISEIAKATKEAQLRGVKIDLDESSQRLVDSYARVGENETLINPTEVYNGQEAHILPASISEISTESFINMLLELDDINKFNSAINNSKTARIYRDIIELLEAETKDAKTLEWLDSLAEKFDVSHSQIQSISSTLYEEFKQEKDILGLFGADQNAVAKLISDLDITEIIKEKLGVELTGKQLLEAIVQNIGDMPELKLKVFRYKVTESFRAGGVDVDYMLFGKTKADISDLEFYSKFENMSVEAIERIFGTGFYTNMFSSLKTLETLVKQVKSIYPGMSTAESVKFLYLMETTEAGGRGICNYAATTNLIMNKYVGREADFLRDFGYPMYIEENGVRIQNRTQLMVDLYATMNAGTLVKVNSDSTYTIANSSEEYVHLTDERRLNENLVNTFFARKGLDLRLEPQFEFSSDKHVEHYGKLLEKISEELQKGNEVQLTAVGFNIYSNGKLLRSNVSGHIMTVVGIDSNGHLIVDSWGRECTIDLKTTLENLGDKYTRKIVLPGGKVITRAFERFVNIASFDLVQGTSSMKTITPSSTTSSIDSSIDTSNTDIDIDSREESVSLETSGTLSESARTSTNVELESMDYSGLEFIPEKYSFLKQFIVENGLVDNAQEIFKFVDGELDLEETLGELENQNLNAKSTLKFWLLLNENMDLSGIEFYDAIQTLAQVFETHESLFESIKTLESEFYTYINNVDVLPILSSTKTTAELVEALSKSNLSNALKMLEIMQENGIEYTNSEGVQVKVELTSGQQEMLRFIKGTGSYGDLSNIFSEDGSVKESFIIEYINSPISYEKQIKYLIENQFKFNLDIESHSSSGYLKVLGLMEENGVEYINNQGILAKVKLTDMQRKLLEFIKDTNFDGDLSEIFNKDGTVSIQRIESTSSLKEVRIKQVLDHGFTINTPDGNISSIEYIAIHLDELIMLDTGKCPRIVETILECIDEDRFRKIFSKLEIDVKMEILNIYADYVDSSNLHLNAFTKFLTHCENLESYTSIQIRRISGMIGRVSFSNSSEMRAISNNIMSALSTKENYEEYITETEDIFLKNNLPKFAKKFKVMELLHFGTQLNIDQILKIPTFNEILSKWLPEDAIMSQEERAMAQEKAIAEIKKIIFRDLLRTTFASNNRDAREYLINIKVGNELFGRIKTKEQFESLTESQKEILRVYASHLDMLYQQLKGRSIVKENLSLFKNLQRLNRVYTSFNRMNLPDMIVKAFAGDAGFSTYSELENFMNESVQRADTRNREFARKFINGEISGESLIHRGDLVKSLASKSLASSILGEGILMPELLLDLPSNATPFDADFWRVTESIGLSIIHAPGFGDIQYVIPTSDSFITTKGTDFQNPNGVSNSVEEALKPGNYELIYGASGTKLIHYGIRTGLPSAEIGFFYASESMDHDYSDSSYLKLQIAMNGFYIPIISKETGQLIFTPEDFDLLRSKMNGLAYYGFGDYQYSSYLMEGAHDIIDGLFTQLQSSKSPLFQINAVREIIGLEGVKVVPTGTYEFTAREGISEILKGDFAKRLSPERVSSLYEALKDGYFDEVIKETAITESDRLEVLLKISELDVVRKRNAVNSTINKVLSEVAKEFGIDLTAKTELDPEVTIGNVELIDTGSTGRKANLPGDGDFDFTVRIDRALFMNSKFMEEFSRRLHQEFGRISERAPGEEAFQKVSTDSYGIRDKYIKLEGLDVLVDIDISFIQKTNRYDYSTDMALAERYESMKDSRARDLAIANVLRLKAAMKEGKCYKPYRSDHNQGGLGGIGVENLVLQNGGSLIEGAMSFLEGTRTITYAEYLVSNPNATFVDYLKATGDARLSFEEFNKHYQLCDFGSNHFAEKRATGRTEAAISSNYYPFDNFITGNMSKEGYAKAVKVLEDLIIKADPKPFDRITKITPSSDMSSMTDTHTEDEMVSEVEEYATVEDESIFEESAPSPTLARSSGLIYGPKKSSTTGFHEATDADLEDNKSTTSETKEVKVGESTITGKPSTIVDLSKIHSSDELLSVLFNNNSLENNALRDKSYIKYWLEALKEGKIKPDSYDSRSGENPAASQAAEKIVGFRENVFNSNKIYKLSEEEMDVRGMYDYRITIKNSESINPTDAANFTKALYDELQKQEIGFRTKNLWDADAIILYLDKSQLLDTVKVLEGLKDSTRYGQSVVNAIQNFGETIAFGATISENPYYGISMAHSESEFGAKPSGLRSSYYGGNYGTTFNSYVGEVLLKPTYNELMEKYNKDLSKVTVDEVYNMVLEKHRTYMLGKGSTENIPLWMNRRNYLEYKANNDVSNITKENNGFKMATDDDLARNNPVKDTKALDDMKFRRELDKLYDPDPAIGKLVAKYLNKYAPIYTEENMEKVEKIYKYLSTKRSNEKLAKAIRKYYETKASERGFEEHKHDGVTIKVVNGINTSAQVYGVEYVAAKIDELRAIYGKVDLKEVVIYDTKCPSNCVYMEQYKMKGFDALAEVSVKDGSIKLYATQTFDDMTIYHEYAHMIGTDLVKNNLAISEEWIEAINSDKAFVNEYARTSVEEDFAESVAAYFENPSEFIKKFPSRYEFIKKYVDTGGKVDISKKGRPINEVKMKERVKSGSIGTLSESARISSAIIEETTNNSVNFEDAEALAKYFGDPYLYLWGVLRKRNFNPETRMDRDEFVRTLTDIYRRNPETVNKVVEKLSEGERSIFDSLLQNINSSIQEQWISRLTTDEKMAIRTYAEFFDSIEPYVASEILGRPIDHYVTANDLLRMGYESFANLHLDSAIEKFGVLPDTIVVYRGSGIGSLSQFGEIDTSNLSSLIGKTFIDKAYMSTSLLRSKAKAAVGKSTDVLFKITVPNDANYGAYIESQSNLSYRQAEFLLARNTHAIIENAYVDENGKINIEMRLFKPATEIKVEKSSKESVHKDTKSSMDVISDVKTKKTKSKLLSRIKSFFNPDMTSLTDAEKFKKLDTASNIERINLIVSMKDPSYIEKSIVKLVGLEDKLRVIELLPSEDLKMVAIKKLSYVVPVKRLSQKEFGYLDKDGKYPITYDGKTDTIVIPNDFNKYGESLLSKYETQLSYIARRWGMTSTEVQELFNQKIKEFIDDGIFGRRVKASTISRLLDSGVIYNQFQTGTSQGKNDPYTRIDIEQRVLGVDMFMNAGNRPIYGMVLPEISKDTMEHIFGDKAPGKWYSGTDGCILIFDKDAIIRSTTFTLGDSLNFDANVVASSAIDPKFFGFGESILMEKVRSMSKEQFIKSKLTDIFYDNKDNDYDDHYIELQIHGLDSHSLSFVKEIVFKDTPLPYIQNRLKELGISWRVVE